MNVIWTRVRLPQSPQTNNKWKITNYNMSNIVIPVKYTR